jgi:hypothetical protein
MMPPFQPEDIFDHANKEIRNARAKQEISELSVS